MAENSNSSSPEKMVGTTDCFEAVSTFKGLKNLLFWITLLSLLLLQGLFWVEHLGYVDKKGMDCPLTWGTYPVLFGEEKADEPVAATDPIPDLEAAVPQKSDKMQEGIAKSADAAVESVEPSMEADSESPAPVKAAGEVTEGIVSWKVVFYAVKICNFAAMLSVTLYAIALLVCLQISIAGRLGGIAHVSVAFFRASLVWVLLLPWQNFLRGVCGGVLFGPGELLCGDWSGTMMGEIVTLIRFCGFWLVAFVLLVMAQTRSGKWSKATLRRLGMN